MPTVWMRGFSPYYLRVAKSKERLDVYTADVLYDVVMPESANTSTQKICLFVYAIPSNMVAAERNMVSLIYEIAMHPRNGKAGFSFGVVAHIWDLILSILSDNW